MDALEGLLYVVTNPVKHGLVSHPRHWPGVNTYKQLLGGKPEVYGFMNWSEYSRAKRRARSTGSIVRREDFITKVSLNVETLPMFRHLDTADIQEKLSELIEKRVASLGRERMKKGKGFAGRKTILSQPRKGSFPREVSRSPRPSCYSKIGERIKAHIEEERIKRSWYVESSRKFRLGNYDVEFPPFCIKPPLHHVPREAYPAPT